MKVLVESVKQLIEQGIGEQGRLQYILHMIETGRPLYASDEKYIHSLLEKTETQLNSNEPDFSGTVIDENTHSTKINTNSFTITTTNFIEDTKIIEYLGIVSGEAVMGSNIFRDAFAGISDVIGGRSGQYEKKFREAKKIAISEMIDHAKEYGANAIIGIKIDYEMVRESMMMVAAQGTAVKIVPK